jgi:hypothetical protein
LTLTPFTWNSKRARHYLEKEGFFLTLAGIFNILMTRAIADKKQEKGKSVTCPQKTALTLTLLEPSLFPSLLTPNIITGTVASRCQKP